MDAALTVSDLTLAWRERLALKGLSGAFGWGSLTAVVGPNGSGKSSLLQALTGQMVPAAGRVQTAERVRGRVAYLPQQPQIDRSFPVRVIDVVMLGHWARQGAWRAATGSQALQAQLALQAVGLADFGTRSLAELSVGQFQRVLFARVLVQDAPVILLDEPFAAVDAATTADLLAVVHRWHAEGRTVVAVLHDIEQVRQHFPQTLLLAREAVAWGPTASVLTPAHLAQARRLAEGWDGAVSAPAFAPLHAVAA